MLSRLIGNHPNTEEDIVIGCIHIDTECRQILNERMENLPINFKMVNEATVNDPILQQVTKYHSNQWPPANAITDPDLKQLYIRRESLSLIDNCLLFSDRFVIPRIFRTRLLKQLHKAHPGIERMKSSARSYVYWPSMDKHISSYVQGCNSCSMAAKAPTKTTLAPWDTPSKQWERVIDTLTNLY